jgi:hypothetical protein
LADFPKYTDLDDRDLKAWKEWIDRPETDKFLDETIKKCRDLAKVSSKASGFPIFKPNPE